MQWWIAVLDKQVACEAQHLFLGTSPVVLYTISCVISHPQCLLVHWCHYIVSARQPT